MEWVSDERELKAASAVAIGGGRIGFLIRGWEIESRKCSILTSSLLQEWEEKLQTTHLPEMVFGESCLVLKHASRGVKVHFNAFDALCGWKQEALPPVEVPAAAKWKFRSESNEQVKLDYDYTFTTPYCGSASVEKIAESESGAPEESSCNPHWVDCQEEIDMVALASKEPILFYDEVVLYEDELADNESHAKWMVSSLALPGVDGVLMRLRDTRMHCAFGEGTEPVILRESCWREATFKGLSSKGYPTDSAAYNDPGVINERLPIVMRKTQKLIIR